MMNVAAWNAKEFEAHLAANPGKSFMDMQSLTLWSDENKTKDWIWNQAPTAQHPVARATTL